MKMIQLIHKINKFTYLSKIMNYINGFILGMLFLSLIFPALDISIDQATNITPNNTNYDIIKFNDSANTQKIAKHYNANRKILKMQLHPVVKNNGIQLRNNWSWTNISHNLGLDWLHKQGFDGTNIKIGIIDNGIDFSHDDLKGINYVEKSFASIGEESTQTHGTPVAGVITGSSILNDSGSSPGITIYSAEMGSGVSDQVIIGNFTAAFDWLISNNVDIINTSWGGANNWTSIMDKLEENNIILVGSNGNTGSNTPPSGPAADIKGISVGWLTDIDTINPLSTIGPNAQFNAKPDVVVYGDLQSLLVSQGIGWVSGSSFASPLVAGGIASVLSGLKANNITWNNGLIKSALLETTTELFNYNYYAQGSGRPNFTKMYEYLLKNSTGLSITPLNFELEEFDNLSDGILDKLPITVISSDPLNYTININGNLSLILYEKMINHYSVNPIILNTRNKRFGYYNGTIEIKLYNLTHIISWSTHINRKFKGLIGLDYFHNDDFRQEKVEFSNNNQFVNNLRERGYWIRPILDEIDVHILKSIDLLYIKNPFELSSEDIFYFSDGEINLLYDFVDVMKKPILFVFDNYKDIVNGDTISFETNTTLINTFINHWNISTPEITPTIREDNFLKLKNSTTYARFTSTIAFRGNSLVGGNSLTNDYLRGIVTNNTNGNFVVSSSSRWTDTDFIFDLISWMIDNYKVAINSQISSTNLHLNFDFINTPQIASKFKITNLYYNKSINSVNFTQVPKQNKWNMDLELQNGFNYWEIQWIDYSTNELLYYIRDDYQSNNYLFVDVTPPVIEQLSTDVSLNTSYPEEIINFRYYDNYQVDTTSIELIADNLTVNTFSYNETFVVVSININQFNRTLNSHYIKLMIADLKGNSVSLTKTISVDFESPTLVTTTNSETTARISKTTDTSTQTKKIQSSSDYTGIILGSLILAIVAVLFGYNYMINRLQRGK